MATSGATAGLPQAGPTGARSSASVGNRRSESNAGKDEAIMGFGRKKDGGTAGETVARRHRRGEEADARVPHSLPAGTEFGCAGPSVTQGRA